ncbi:protein containing RHS repeats [Beggiatoa sp. PS]|nr:protein containing RHS repeats [Beggiatoa sp. PS]
MKLKAYHSRWLNPIPLIGLVLAWFFLTTTVMADTEISENPLPTLGTAEDSESSFAGGISVDGANPQQSVITDVTDYLDITGHITVAPEHIDQVVDILVYGDYQPLLPPEIDPFYFMLDTSGSALVWEQDIADLVPFQNAISLKPVQSVPIYRGHLTTIGSLNISFAYRLSDDTVVSSPETLQATIKPTTYATFDVRTGIMHIPAISVPNGLGSVDIYQADLILANSESSFPPLFNPPPSFQLLNATLVEDETEVVHASYDPDIGDALFEGVYVLGLSETQSFSETLTLEPETGLFIVSSRTQLPYFRGLSELPTITFDTLKLTWPPVTSSAEGEISYEIHLSEEPDFEPTDDTLSATIVGETEYELTDLAADTTHYVLVIAVDKQGHRSLEREYYAFDTQIPPQVPGFSSQPAPGEVVNFYKSFVDRPGVAQFINVAETGEMLLTVDFIGITGEHASDFKMISPEFPFTIEDGGRDKTIKVQCFASELDLRTATLQLSTNDPLLPEVNYTLECKGVSTYTPPDLCCIYTPMPIYHSAPEPNSTIVFNEFGNANTIVSQTITISERGDVDLTMTSYSITGTHANDFSVLSPAFPFTIADGSEDQAVTVQCSPSEVGLRTAQLQINNNDPKRSVVEYSLECTNANLTDDSSEPTTQPNIQPDNLVPNRTVRTAVNTLASGTEFLYTGADALQKCVAEGTIRSSRVAILRGKVMNAQGQPLPEVQVSVDSHAEYGYTFTDDKGEFTLAVNGGGSSLTLNYETSGYMPTQREIRAIRQEYVWVNDVAMIPPDQGAGLDLSTLTTQTVETPVSNDADGSRQAIVIFPPETKATMTLPNCVVEALDGDLTVRASEYTVGDNGPQAMPLPLPSDSSYTYAIDLNIDQAIEANARRIDFDKAFPVYVDNFLGFEVGSIVPSGWYDRTQNAWIPSDNGKVVQILRIDNGRAVLDVDGSNQPANAQTLAQLNVSDNELEQLATFYPNATNKSLWRVLINHFTPWDFNWPRIPPDDAKNPPDEEPTNPEDEIPPDSDDEDCKGGCIIKVQSQVLGESIPITGTPFSLNYRSNRVRGRQSAYRLDIPLRTDEPLPASLKRIELEITIAGQRIIKIYPKENAEKNFIFVWDGKDVFGRVMPGQQKAQVTVSYVYDGFYAVPAEAAQSFGYSGDGQGTLIPAREEIKLERKDTKTLGIWDAKSVGFGGLTLDVHHTYDPKAEMLYRGDGGQKPMEFTYSRQNSAQIEDTSEPQPEPQTVELTDSDIRISHCTDDCGKVLVGAARVEPNSIQWISPQAASEVYVSGYHEAFGFTGQSGEYNSDNQWWLSDTDYIDINNPLTSGNAPSMGHFFAPTNPGSFEASSYVDASFTPLKDGYRSIDLKGEGVADNDFNPAITLDIAVSGSKSPVQPPVDHAAQCVSAPTEGEITFTMTPRVDPNRLPADVAPVQYMIVELTAIEKNTDCNLDGAAFQDTILTAESFVGNDYFHILEDDRGSDCQRDYTFLVSVDKPIQIIASNQHVTQGGFVDYTFAVRGHYEKTNVAKWPNSHKSFHLVSLNNTRRATRRSCPVNNAPSNGDFNFRGQMASQDGGLLYIFDKGLHIKTIDSMTGQAVYTFGYNEAGYLISITDLDDNVTTIERDANHQPLAIVAPYGQRTTLTLNANGYLASVSNPANESHQMVYSADGLLLQYTNPRGIVDKFEYDPLGMLIKNINAVNGGWDVARTDGNSYTVTMTSGTGRVSSFKVEKLTGDDMRRTNIAPDGTKTEIVKKVRYQRVEKTITRADGTVIVIEESRDPRFESGTGQSFIPTRMTIRTPGGLEANIVTNRLVELTENYGTYEPSMLKKVIDKVTINGRISTSVRDNVTKTITFTSAANRQHVSHLDDKGRILVRKTPGLVDFQYRYNERGRLAMLTEGEGATAKTVTINYDNQGNISTLTDMLTRQSSLAYDAVGRVISQTLPDQRQIDYSYDANDNVTSITPPKRPVHHFAYTEQELLKRYTPPAVAGVTTPQTDYEYNLDKQLIKVVRPGGQNMVFNYGATTGRLDGMTLPNGQRQYAYDANTGHLVTITGIDGGTLSYSYDGFLPLSETWNNGTIQGKLSLTYDNDFRVTATRINEDNSINYQYDADSLLINAGDLSLTRDAQNGLLTGTQLGNITTQHTYNPFGELASNTASNSGNVLYSNQYTRDKLGRITQKVETLEGVNTTDVYGYDPAGRLVTVTQNGVVTEQYTYDANGNRLTANTTTYGEVNGRYDEQDRLLEYGGNTYTYTANGELLTKNESGAITEYEYDVLGNLRSVQLPDSTQIEYVIDGRNRRIGKKINGQLVQGFLYQGALNPIAELDSNGNVVSIFIYGSKINVPDYMLKNGKTYRILSDHLGSPRLVIDITDGSVVQHMDYDTFGNILSDSNPGFQPFGFAGGLYDVNTGLIRFGARDYEPEIGRWTAKDPILFDGGDTNLYGYVVNDPINFVDLFGLKVDTGKIREDFRACLKEMTNNGQRLDKLSPWIGNILGKLGSDYQNCYEQAETLEKCLERKGHTYEDEGWRWDPYEGIDTPWYDWTKTYDDFGRGFFRDHYWLKGLNYNDYIDGSGPVLEIHLDPWKGDVLYIGPLK